MSEYRILKNNDGTFIPQFHKKDIPIEKGIYEIAPEPKLWREYTDHGDLFVLDNHKRFRVEVKGTRYEFMNMQTYNYPHLLIIGKRQFDEANPPVDKIIIVNKQLTAVASVAADTRNKWWVEQRRENYYGDGNMQSFYFCNKKLAIWYPI